MVSIYFILVSAPSASQALNLGFIWRIEDTVSNAKRTKELNQVLVLIKIELLKKTFPFLKGKTVFS